VSYKVLTSHPDVLLLLYQFLMEQIAGTKAQLIPDNEPVR
jgi:hypothetical protein